MKSFMNLVQALLHGHSFVTANFVKYFWTAVWWNRRVFLPFGERIRRFFPYPDTEKSRGSTIHITASKHRSDLCSAVASANTVGKTRSWTINLEGSPRKTGTGHERNRRWRSAAEEKRWEARRRMRNCAVCSVMTTMNRRRETVWMQASRINLPDENRAVAKGRGWKLAMTRRERDSREGKNENVIRTAAIFLGEISSN